MSVTPPAGPRLESRDLVLMQALAEHGGVTRAARALALTQSAVSHHLARLEDKLGLALFERVGRGLVITEAGQKLTDGGRALLDQLTALERSLAPRTPSRIRVTTQCHTAYDWLAPVLGRFGRAHPATQVVVKVDCTRIPLAALRNKKVDLAICHAPAEPGQVEHPLGEDPFVVVLRPDHPAASGDRVRPAQLRRDTLLVHDLPTAELVELGQAWFGDNPPAHTMRLPLTEAMIELCATGYGVAMMPGWAARHALKRHDVVVRQFAKKGASRAWRAVVREADEARDDLRDLVRELQAWFATR